MTRILSFISLNLVERLPSCCQAGLSLLLWHRKWLTAFLLAASASYADDSQVLRIGYIIAPPWGYAADSEWQGLIPEIYRSAMVELGITRFEFKSAPALRVNKQLNRGSITMAIMTDKILPSLTENIACSRPFDESAIKLYSLTGAALNDHAEYRVALPNESIDYMTGMLPEGAQYSAVGPRLLAELLTSGRYPQVMDFASRIEPMLKAAGTGFESTLVARNKVHVCIQSSFQDSQRILEVTAKAMGSFRFTPHGRDLFLRHGIEPETNLPINRQ